MLPTETLLPSPLPEARSPVTVRDLLLEARARLAPASDSPALDAEVLLTHVTGLDAVAIIVNDSRPLGDDVVARCRALVARRAEGEPIAHLTGRREFWSLAFEVSPHVLIPRPDTETLVQRALDLVPKNADWGLLDLGAGSGNVAIALAKERPRCRVTAVDVDTVALEVARANGRRLGAQRIEFLLSDWFDALKGQRFHVIVGNPPYVAESDPHLTAGDVAHEPRRALVSRDEGLADIAHITREARAYLRAPGWLLLEHGAEQGEAVRALMGAGGFEEVATVRDLGGRERVTGGRVAGPAD